jgi:hypothetical protein
VAHVIGRICSIFLLPCDSKASHYLCIAENIKRTEFASMKRVDTTSFTSQGIVVVVVVETKEEAANLFSFSAFPTST